MEVARTPDVGVLEGEECFRLRLGSLIAFVGDDRGDRAIDQRPNRGGIGSDGFSAGGIKAAEQAHHAQAGAEALFRMRPISHDGEDQNDNDDDDEDEPAN